MKAVHSGALAFPFEVVITKIEGLEFNHIFDQLHLVIRRKSSQLFLLTSSSSSSLNQVDSLALFFTFLLESRHWAAF